MTVTIVGDCIRLAGRCGVEDAEALLAALQGQAMLAVDLADCKTLHTSIVQVLLFSRAKLVAAPMEPTLRRWLVPLLASEGDAFELLPDRL